MILSKEEKAAHRAAFRDMSPSQKLDHIFTYYKGPILLGLVALLILGWAVHRQFTQKQSILSLAFANVAAGEDLEHDLTGGFLEWLGYGTRRYGAETDPGIGSPGKNPIRSFRRVFARHPGRPDALLFLRKRDTLL